MGQGLTQPQLLEKGTAMGHKLWSWQRRGGHRHVVTREDLAGLVVAAITAGLGIWLQRLEQGIVSPLGKLRKACYRHCCWHSCRHCCGHWSIGFWSWLALAMRAVILQESNLRQVSSQVV